MAESKEISSPESRLVPLTETIYEVHQAIRIVEDSDDHSPQHSLDLYRDVLLLLLRVADAKMYYYEQKYDLEIPEEDVFFIDDVIDFGLAYANYKAEKGKNGLPKRRNL